MRVHVHTAPEQRASLTEAIWRDACARHPDVGAGHEISFGHSVDALAAALPSTELLISTSTLPRPLPAPAPDLRLIFLTYAGVDRLQPLDWIPDGVVLLNNSGAHGARAGEFAIMSILMLANHVPTFVADQRERRWDRRLATVLAGRSLTIIGLGGLGDAAAIRAGQFGMTVTGVRTRAARHPHCARVVATEDLDAVLGTTEFLLLACPLTPATRHLLDRRRIGLLPPGAFVINIGRGPLLEEDALADALESGRLGGAVLDVFDQEPPPPDHRFWATPNLMMTPHISCDDAGRYFPNSLDVLMRNLRAIAAGEDPPNRVDPALGY